MGSLSSLRTKRLRAATYLVSEVLELECIVINAKSEIVLECPPKHVKKCFCKRLESITGKKNTLDHFFERCTGASEETTYSIYSCPFGLANIIVPVYDGGRFINALQIGPILTKDANEILLEHGLSELNAGVEEMQSIRRYLSMLPHGDISYLMMLAKTINALVSDKNLDFEVSPLATGMGSAEYKMDDDPDVICAIQEFVSTNYTDNSISLETVAQNVYVHPSYVSHIFSKQFNCRFRGYINSLRVKTASDLLATTDRPIGDICQEVGFSDHSYFNKVFKQIKGTTPSAYRTAAQKERLTHQRE